MSDVVKRLSRNHHVDFDTLMMCCLMVVWLRFLIVTALVFVFERCVS